MGHSSATNGRRTDRPRRVTTRRPSYFWSDSAAAAAAPVVAQTATASAAGPPRSCPRWSLLRHFRRPLQTRRRRRHRRVDRDTIRNSPIVRRLCSATEGGETLARPTCIVSTVSQLGHTVSQLGHDLVLTEPCFSIDVFETPKECPNTVYSCLQ